MGFFIRIGLRENIIHVSMAELRCGILPCYRSSDFTFSVKILHLMIYNLVSQFLRTSELLCSEHWYKSIQLQSRHNFCNPKLSWICLPRKNLICNWAGRKSGHHSLFKFLFAHRNLRVIQNAPTTLTSGIFMTLLNPPSLLMLMAWNNII